jgi:hypothetical protein
MVKDRTQNSEHRTQNTVVGIVFILLTFTFLLSISGCDSQKLTPQQIQAVANYTDSLNAQLTLYQKAVNDMAATLAAGGVLDANDLSKLAKLNEEINRITPQIAAISAAVKAGEYSQSDTDIITILKAAQAANQASAPFNPYALIIDAVLGAIILVLGLFAKNKSSLLALTTGTLKNVVTGVQASSLSAYDEVTSIIRPLNTAEQKALITSLKPEVPEGFEITKVATPA